MGVVDRKIWLDANRIRYRKSLQLYAEELYGKKIDGFDLHKLEEYLVHLDQNMTIMIGRESVHRICDSAYAFDVLLLLGRVANRNQKIQIQFYE